MNRRMPVQLGFAHHRGFVLPMVLFLIVVLAGAAVAISQLTVDTTASNIQALQKTRADLFNQSLLDLAVHELVTEGDCPPTGPHTHSDFPGLEAEIDCSSEAHNTSGTGDFVLWTVTATTATAGAAPSDEEYVWRRMTSVVEL